MPPLKAVDRVHQHCEHQALLSAETATADCVEILTRQNNVGQCQSIRRIKRTPLDLLHFPFYCSLFGGQGFDDLVEAFNIAFEAASPM